ncbi:MAG: hypothetical protein KGJ55_08300 [Gammaproteobacteria bacterium]|nr:hypothetical protein [Gammaproteobacteria bacterium]
MTFVDLLVEGPTDEMALSRILSDVGLEKGTTFGRRGIPEVRRLAPGLVKRASGSGIPLLILVDLIGSGDDCAAHIPDSIALHRDEKTLVRVAVRELESWLLADVDGLRSFFGDIGKWVLRDPEAEHDPKRAFFNIARKSKRHNTREGLVSERDGSLVAGPDYLGLMSEFLSQHWNPARARERADSLCRCMSRIEALA